MVLKTTTIDTEITSVNARLAALATKIVKTTKTLSNYKKKKNKLTDMKARLEVSKLHVEKFNVLEEKG